jgi:hypothetical protein
MNTSMNQNMHSAISTGNLHTNINSASISYTNAEKTVPAIANNIKVQRLTLTVTEIKDKFANEQSTEMTEKEENQIVRKFLETNVIRK